MVTSNNVFKYIFVCEIIFVLTVAGVDFIIERPHVSYYNEKYIEYVNITSTRGRRGEPYKVNIYGTIQQPWGKNVTIDLLFLELLSNEYKPSFIHARTNLCDLVKNDMWTGRALYNAGLKDLSCPYPQGYYALVNMSIPSRNVPDSFPFRNGKVNVTVTQNESNELMCLGTVYITIHLPISNQKKMSKKNTKRNIIK